MTSTLQPVCARLRRPADHPAPLRVLLLHGLGGNGTVWRALAERAPRRLELWDADLPWGSEGETGWVEQPDIGRWVKEAITSIPGRADVVAAHSFAATALLVVLDRTRVPRPGAVVLVSPFYRPRREDFTFQAVRDSLDVFPRLVEEGVELYSRRPLAPEVRQGMAQHILDRIGPYGWARFLELYLGTPQIRAARLRMPFLLVGGEHDDAALPADSRALADVLPNSRMEIFTGCGHFPMVAQPDRFARLVEQFLATVFGGDPT